MGYYEMMQRRGRRKMPKNWREHKGDKDDYYGIVDAASREYGRSGCFREWWRNRFAADMFNIIKDPRSLHRARATLKGAAAGHDGVGPGEIWRYAAYRDLFGAMRLFGHKRPQYQETVFPNAPVHHLAALALVLQPAHYYGAKILTFGRRTSEGTIITNISVEQIPLDWFIFSSDFEKQQRQYDATNVGMTVTESTVNLPLPSMNIDRERLMNAALCLQALATVYDLVLHRLCEFVKEQYHYNSSMRLLEFKPIQFLREAIEDEEEGRGRYNTHMTWEAMRWISGLLTPRKNGNGFQYRPEPLRQVSIRKPDGGTRTLSLPSAVDRIVAKSVLLTVQPMFEEVFLPSSVGCRLDRDRFDVLAALANDYPAAKGKFILCADIKKAFDNVRHQDLLAVVNKYIGEGRVRELLRRFIQRDGFVDKGVGIAQGCPLSPLFLNILLHEALDAPLSKLLPQGILNFRYVDDLCFFGFSTEQEGQDLIALVQRLLNPIGLELHTAPPKTQIVNLAHSPITPPWMSTEEEDGTLHQVDRYLGLGLRGRADNTLEFFLPPSWRDGVREMFVQAEDTIKRKGYAGRNGAHKHIRRAAESWLAAYAPAWTAESERDVVAEVIRIAMDTSQHGADLDLGTQAHWWRMKHKWWERKCREVATVLI